MEHLVMANTVFVGNPNLNPTAASGTGFSYQYNPSAPTQVLGAQQAVEQQAAAEQQRMQDEYAAAEQQRMQDEYAAQIQAAVAAQGVQQQPQPLAADTSSFAPDQEIDFTSYAQQNDWANSSTFRRKELATKMLDTLKEKGATKPYIDAVAKAVASKATEWGQPIDAPDRGLGLNNGVLGDVVAGGARAVNSLAGLVSDVVTGITPFDASGLKTASDSTVGAFERGMQSAETANLIKRANELISEGRWKDIAGFLAENPSLAAYAGLPELLGSKGIGVAAKGVTKGLTVAQNAAKLGNVAEEGTKAYKAIELGKRAAGLGTVMAAQGRGQVFNAATIAGTPITEDVRSIANQNAAAQGAFGVLGAGHSVEAVFARTPVLGSLFRSADDIDRLAVTAASAPREAVSIITAAAKTAGVEMTQEYAENTVQSLLQAKINSDGTARDLTQLDWDRAKAEGLYGALLSAGPGAVVGGREAQLHNREADAYNALITTKKTEQAAEDTRIQQAQAAADTLHEAANTAAQTADEAMAALQAERANRQSTMEKGRVAMEELRQQAEAADPLTKAQATQALIDHTVAQTQLEQRDSAVKSASRAVLEQSNQSDKVKYDAAVRDAGIQESVVRPGLEWDTNFTSEELRAAKRMAPSIDLSTSQDPMKSIADAAAAVSDTSTIQGLVPLRNMVSTVLASRRPMAATARRVLAQHIANNTPFDVEQAIVSAAPYLADPETRMSFLTTLPANIIQQLSTLDTQTAQPTLNGFAPAISAPDRAPSPRVISRAAAKDVAESAAAIAMQASIPDMFPNSAETLAAPVGGTSALDTQAGYVKPQNGYAHARAAATAELMHNNASIVEAAQAHANATDAAIVARKAAWALDHNDISPEAEAIRGVAVDAATAARAAKVAADTARKTFLEESSRSTKFQALIAAYGDLIAKAERNNKFTSDAVKFTYTEEAADAAADLLMEQMDQFLAIQNTPTPVTVTPDMKGLAGVKFDMTAWTPKVNTAARKRVALGKLSQETNKSRADRLAATEAAVKALGLGKVSTPEEVQNRRDAQYAKIDDAKATLATAINNVASAQQAVDNIVAGDKSLAAGALRVRLAREKATVTAITTKLNNLVTGLKKIDPVAYHDYKAQQDKVANDAKIATLQSALTSAEGSLATYIAQNAAVSGSKKYTSDVKTMTAAIEKAKGKLFEVQGTPFDYEAARQKIEAAYQEAVLAAVQVTPAQLDEFASRASSVAGTQLIATDFIAAFDDNQQMAGTATLDDDKTTWHVEYTDTNGIPKTAQMVDKEDVFRFFRAQNLQPTLRSRNAGQSTHASRALNLEERGGRYSRPFLKVIASVFGEEGALKMLDFVDGTLFSLARQLRPLEEIDRIYAANGVEGINLANDWQLNSAKFNAFRSQMGATSQSHLDAVNQSYKLIQDLSAPAKAVFDDYAYAIAAKSRHAWLTRDEPLDRNTGLPKDRTSGFSYIDPTTRQSVSDQTGEKYIAMIERSLPQADREAMDAIVKYIAGQGVIVSHMEARNGVITEAALQQRLAEHAAGNYYLPLQDEKSVSLSKKAKGRYNKAASPVVRMIMNMDARIGVVGSMANKNALYDTLMSTPIPHIATINTEVEVADGHGNVKWVMDDPFSARTIRVLRPDGTRARITFAEKGTGARMAKLLTPQNIPTWVAYANMGKRYFSQMMTTFSPKMMPVQIARDMLIVPFNMEQASEGLLNSRQSLRLGAKAAMLTPVYLASALKGKFAPESRPVLLKHLLADGGLIQMAFKNEYGAQQDLMNLKSGYTSAAGGLSKMRHVTAAVHKAEDILHFTDMAPRMAYANVMVKHISGKNIRTEEDMALFKSQYPEEYKKIILGTKNITLNFEQYGNSPYLRATIPFFGTAMNATFGALPRGLATKSGITYMAVLAGASYVAAMSGGAGSGEDEDGKEKFFRNNNLTTSIEIGGVAVPLPQEMYLAHMMGTALAALQRDQWTTAEASAEIALAGVEGFSPVRANLDPNSQQPFGDRVLAAGPWGFLVQPLITQNDAFGRPLANPKPRGADGKLIENPADWERAYANSAEWSKSLTAGIHGAVDVSPGAAEQTARIMLGGLYGVAKDFGKGMSTSENILSRFTPKPNEYKMDADYKLMEAKYNQLSRDPAVTGNMFAQPSKAAALLAESSKQDEQYSREIGKYTRAMLEAKQSGNTATADGYQAQIDLLTQARRDNKGAVMRQIYDLEK